MNNHRLWKGVTFLLAAGLSACGGGGGSVPNIAGVASTQNTATAQRVNERTTQSSNVAASASYIAIDAGGAATGVWIADAFSNGGNTFGSTSPVSTTSVVNPAPQSVYKTQRYGSDLEYVVPNLTPNAAYTVRLHFAETYFGGPGQRVFSIRINGNSVLTDFDIFKVTGGSNRAIVKEFTASANSAGKITVQMTASTNNASIAGLEMVRLSNTPSPTPASTVVAINAGGAAVGNWLGDAGYNGGWIASVTNSIDTNLVSNSAPQSVYQSQRTGSNFSYTLRNLSPNTAYVVRLHLVESWFTSAGQRVFNVSANGVPALTAVDTFQAAGGTNVAIAKSFAASADGAGNITLQFTATINNASVAGIEVIGGTASAPPSPTPTATASPMPINGAGWPAPGWVPYPKGPLTVPVAPNPTYTAGSADIINAMWGGRSSDPGHIEVVAGPPPGGSHDFSQPLYFGHSGDPEYTISCYDFGGGCPASGVRVHIPRGAYPAGGSDEHIAIRDLATGNDVMLWLSPIPNGNGGSLSVGWGTVIPSNGEGLNAIGGSASGLSAIWALRETDLAHDSINHALVVGINGESADGFVYPASGWDNGYFHSNPWPRMGAHFWLDVGPPYSSGCPQYAVSYLTALHKYGAYAADQGAISGPIQASYESDMDYTYNGGASAWGPLMQSLGGSYVGHNVFVIDNCGVNMQAHMHILNPPAHV